MPAQWATAPVVRTETVPPAQPGAGWQGAPTVQTVRQAEERPFAAFTHGMSRGLQQLLDIPTQGLAGAWNVLTGGDLQWRPFQTAGQAIGLGTYQPQTERERKAAFAGEMAGASVLPGGAATRMATLPGRALAGELTALGGSIAGGLGGGDIAATIGGERARPIGEALGAGLGGIAAPATLPAATAYATRTAISPIGQRTMQGTIEAARRQQVPITAGQAMGGSAIEKITSVLPGGRFVADKFADAQKAALSQRMDDITTTIARGEASPETAGRAIRRGLEDWTEDFRTTGRQLDENIAMHVPEGTTIPLENTRGVLDELVMDEEFSAILDAPMIRQLARRIGGGEGQTMELPFNVMRAVRSRIGERLSSPELMADAPKGQLKKLYGALSKDMEDTVRMAGPEASHAWDRFNSYWSAGRKRLDDFLDPIQKQTTPEKIYTAAMSGAKEGPSKLRALKKSVSPEQWAVLQGTTLRRMGKAVPSAREGGELTEEVMEFSPETFLTNVERMDKGSRKVLFSGSGYEDLERNVEDLMTIAQGIRAQTRTIYNPSGTGGLLTAAAPALGALYAPTTIGPGVLAGLAGATGIQRGLQSQALLDYLMRPTALPAGPVGQAARAGVALQQ